MLIVIPGQKGITLRQETSRAFPVPEGITHLYEKIFVVGLAIVEAFPALARAGFWPNWTLLDGATGEPWDPSTPAEVVIFAGHELPAGVDPSALRVGWNTWKKVLDPTLTPEEDRIMRVFYAPVSDPAVRVTDDGMLQETFPIYAIRYLPDGRRIGGPSPFA